jgi:two-component system response regulator MprA
MTRHILVVDDHRGVRDALRFVLEDAGYRVTTAADGHQALERIAAERPDVVLSDLQMPVLSGAELHARLLALDPTLPVVFMSEDPAVAGLAAAHGADGYLVKPFEPDALIALLARLAPCRAV